MIRCSVRRSAATGEGWMAGGHYDAEPNRTALWRSFGNNSVKAYNWIRDNEDINGTRRSNIMKCTEWFYDQETMQVANYSISFTVISQIKHYGNNDITVYSFRRRW